MNPLEIIEKYYDPGSKAYYFLVHHGRSVAAKALAIASRAAHLTPDITFIEEASMLHDIGIFYTKAPRLGCFGDKSYLCHGYLGRELLDREGLPRHALVCERHVGVGITLEEIRKNRLPLPEREMVPLTTEEKIVCLADKFFSKNDEDLFRERPIGKVREMVASYGKGKVETFDEWMKLFHG
jgi:uncharacterized protein